MPNAAPAPRAARGRRVPRPLVAAFLSGIIPGAGHLYGGWRRRGWVFITITAALVVPAALLLFFVIYGNTLSLALTLSKPFFQHPALFLVLLAANAILLAFRIAVVVDAYLVCRPMTRHGVTAPTGVVAGLALAVILAGTAVPHVYVGRRNLLLYDAVTFDYVSDPGQSTTLGTSTTRGDGATGTTRNDTPSSTAPSTTILLPDTFTDGTRVNILLLGGDAGVGRRNIRTDSMIVVSIDPETGWTAMFGIPRNLIHVPIPESSPAHGVWDCPGGCYPKIANEIYQSGLDYPDLFPGGPNSGGNATKLLLGNLLGIEIDYFALVDFVGFVEMIDAVGGVDINVLDRIYDETYPNTDGTLTTIVIEPGIQHMDGERALQYARSRHGVEGSDFGRMSHQRCVLEALATQTDPLTLFQELPTFVPAIQESVTTDIPIAELPAFIELAAMADLEHIVTTRFMPNAPEFEGTPTSYIAEYTADRYPVPDRDFIAETVAIALTLPPLEAIERLNFQPLEDACGP